MMSPVAQRIYEKINNLIKERDEIQAQINRLKQAIDNMKKHMHHTELEIVAEGATDPSGGLSDIRFANEIRELNKGRAELHSDEKMLNDLTIKVKSLTKTIEDYRFWMHRADTADPARQQEAERRVFG